ncbi:hypothetical protein F4808DRAFT_456902 [Astrocystis sublimbata]|nr:hypothetical protein F4808DRAFT_456902 [Astrocystis sublimbata]
METIETSAPKRRKTSPTTSAHVNEPHEPASSDSANSATRRSARLNPQAFSSPGNVTFPRSYSELFGQHTSPRANEHDDDVEFSLPAASEPGSPASQERTEDDLASAQLALESESGTAKATKARVTRPASPVRRAGGGLSIRPRRTPTKPSPRPLPPPSADEEELIDPFKRKGLRRSPPPGVLPHMDPEEPELPPTPTQKGLSDPSSIVTSPTGIHNTPSKKPRKSMGLAAKMHSSPLKQPPLRPLEFAREAPELLLPRESPSPREEPRRKRRKRGPHPARKIEELDPLAAEKALRDALLAEVKQLQDDLRVATRENERLAAVQEDRSRRRTAADFPLPDVGEQSRLLDVLRRHVLPPEEEPPPDPMFNWLEAAMNPIAFLPFGSGANPPPLTLPGTNVPHAQDQEKVEEKPPVSHHPVSMAEDEELPYLQVFRPLTFTSTVTTLQQESDTFEEAEADAKPLLQHHAISVASVPLGLFAASLDMTVDTKNLSIAELAVPRLDPAAIPELGPFIDNILQGGDSSSGGSSERRTRNSALKRNITVVTWAMGEWVRLATRRARFWHALTRELGSREQVVRCAEGMRRRTKRGRGVPYDDVGGADLEDGTDKSEKKEPSKADVIALMGRTSLDLELPTGGEEDGEGEGEEEVTARITWKVDFDWTGEARSRIELAMSAPGKWHARDDKKSLAGLPDMFNKLLAERKDPLEAVKIVVALVVGDGLQA